MSRSDDSANIFNASNIDAAYWDTYLTARPKYSPAFYDLIYRYHASKGSGGLSIVHDVGAGPGQVAAAVASRVDMIHLSDVNEKHLDVARHYLSRIPKSLAKASFTTCSGTTLREHFPQGEADLLLCGESFALMDVDAALDNFAQVLKPRGTLAIWYYGRPMFAGGSRAAECQSIYDRIVNTLFSRVIKGGGATKQAQWKRTTDVMASWFDSVSFPERVWTGVERHKWNSDGQMTFYDDSACDFEVMRTSNVAPSDVVRDKIDRSFWGDEWDLSDVRAFIDVNLPPFARNDQKDESIETLYEALAEAMGGSTIKHDIAWPVVLLLARRKDFET